MPRDTPTPSFRTSARRNDYHLSTPPPLRTGAPLVVVARGRRFRIQLTGSQSAEAHSPTLTEPASSPINPANAGRALRRARRIVEPAELDLESHAATVSGGESGTIPTVPGLDQQVHDVTPTSSPTTAASQHGHDDLFSTHDGLEETPITGLHLGTGVYRLANSNTLSLQTFDAPMPRDEFAHLRLVVDSPDGGLTGAQLRELVGECDGCKRIMNLRSKGHHRCPGKNALPNTVPEKDLFFLLDTTAGGEGITKHQFQYCFLECADCRLFFTYDAGCQHAHTD